MRPTCIAGDRHSRSPGASGMPGPEMRCYARVIRREADAERFTWVVYIG